MEYEKIKQLMDDMGNSKLTELDIDFPDGTKISMKKENNQIVEIAKSKPVETIVETKEVVTENRTLIQEDDSNIITSPMVGTFYMKPSPDSKPYVEVGSIVHKGDIVCIIEAMKLMNEIESEFDGEVIEILVKDGEAVEYGKPLFKIK